MSYSDTFEVNVPSEGSKLVVTTRDWTEISAYLRSNAEGNNRLILSGGSGRFVAPGAEIHMVLAPNTKIEVSTTANDGAEWHFALTERSDISAQKAREERILEQLNEIRCGIGLLAGVKVA